MINQKNHCYSNKYTPSVKQIFEYTPNYLVANYLENIQIYDICDHHIHQESKVAIHKRVPAIFRRSFQLFILDLGGHMQGSQNPTTNKRSRCSPDCNLALASPVRIQETTSRAVTPEIAAPAARGRFLPITAPIGRLSARQNEQGRQFKRSTPCRSQFSNRFPTRRLAKMKPTPKHVGCATTLGHSHPATRQRQWPDYSAFR